MLQAIGGTSGAAFRKLGRGTFSQAYAVRAGGSRYLLRVSLLKDHPSGYTEEAALLTHPDLDAVRKFLPRILDTDVTRNTVPYEYQVQKMMEGDSLYDLALRNDVSDMIGNFGKLVAGIHTVRGRGGYGAVSAANGSLRGRYGTWRDTVLEDLNSQLELLVSKGLFGKRRAIAISRAVSGQPLEDVAPVLLHGDLAHHNVIIHGKTVRGLVDWEDALLGDPLYDIAYYHTGCFGRERWMDAFLMGYRNVAGKDAVMMSNSYWTYYTVIAVAKAVSRILYPGEDEGKLPDIRERIGFGLLKLRRK